MMRRAREQMGRKRFPWSEKEDRRLVETVEYMQRHDKLDKRGGWRDVSRLAGLNRSGKSCSLRWNSYLRPDIKRGLFSKFQSSVHRNKWAIIAAELPGRTITEIKNLWNTRLKKKKNLPNKETPTVLQELVATGDSLASAVNGLKDKIMRLHPDPDGIGSLFANATPISTAPVSGVSSEPSSVVNQILEIGEITLSDQEIANPSSSTSATFEAWLDQLLRDNETSDIFCGDLSLH